MWNLHIQSQKKLEHPHPDILHFLSFYVQCDNASPPYPHQWDNYILDLTLTITVPLAVTIQLPLISATSLASSLPMRLIVSHIATYH